MNDTLDDDAWASYWATGASAAMHDWAGSDPVARAVAEFWRDLAHNLHGRVVMDVGCGNAAIAQMLGEQSAAAVANWLLIDAAPISMDALPSALRSRCAVHAPVDFVTSGAALPASCDMLVSNFGLEYTRWPQAATACAQVLRSGGKLVALMHGAGTEVHLSAQRELEELVFMMDTLAFESHASALLVAARDVPADPLERMMHGVAARDAYNRMVERAKAYLSATDRGRNSRLAVALTLCGQAARALSEGKGTEEVTVFERFVAELHKERRRLTQMCTSARDEEQMEDIASMLASEGFVLAPGGVLTCSQGNVAWVLRAMKSSELM